MAELTKRQYIWNELININQYRQLYLCGYLRVQKYEDLSVCSQISPKLKKNKVK